jgi:hypothetical protein
MIAAFILNFLIISHTYELIYVFLFIAQSLFYFLSLLGWFFEKRHVRVKALFIPYYFCMMNYAVIAGIGRYLTKSQSAVWDKAKRR